VVVLVMALLRCSPLRIRHSEPNGKSVFISTVAGIFNSYSLTAPVDMFLVSKFERLQKRSALSKMDNKELKYIDRYIHQSLF
jgi:hypothetical protein